MIGGPIAARNAVGGVIAQSARRAASVVWTPDLLSDLHLWLDANDLSTLFQQLDGTTAVVSDGDPVGYWTDKSVNGFDAFAQANDATRFALIADGLNSKPVVRSAIGDILVNTNFGWSNEAYTIAMVYKFTAWSQNGGIFCIKSNGSGSDFNTNGGCAITQHSSNTAQTNLTINPTAQTSVGLATNFRILTLVFDGTNKITVRENGVVILTDHVYNRPYSASNGYLLNGRFVSGVIRATNRPSNDYAEIVNAAKVVSVEEHNLLGGYLASKWGLSWTEVT